MPKIGEGVQPMGKAIATTTETMSGDQFARVTDRLLPYLRKEAGHLPKAVGQRVLNEELDVLIPEMAQPLIRRIEAKLVLAPRGTMTVALPERHDPDSFYRTRSGFWVYDGFRRLVVSKAEPTKQGTTFVVSAFELMRDLTDEQIEEGLPAEYNFDETDLCVIIAGMIAKQPRGEEGKLLNDGRANLFYLRSCVVRVYWSAGSEEWNVRTWDRDDNTWNASNRVFSPATEN